MGVRSCQKLGLESWGGKIVEAGLKVKRLFNPITERDNWVTGLT